MGAMRKVLNWYARLSPSRGKTSPPYRTFGRTRAQLHLLQFYRRAILRFLLDLIWSSSDNIPVRYEHVVQIGDPRLRKVSDPVPVDKIKSEEVQKVINKLRLVLHRYGSVGMSAPQIGVNMRMFVMRHTAKQISAVPPEIAKSKGVSVVPFTVFINPKIKVVDYQKVIYMEGCESVQGYSAEVPRYREVEVTGYDENGESATRVFKLWPARIAQHEMDHLDGKMFTDLMERRTLTCACWEEVNLSKGKVVIPFNPE